MVLPLRGRSKEQLVESQFEQILGNASKLAIIAIAMVALLAALHVGQVILAPIAMAVVVGLMFGPMADFMETRGVPPALSGAVVVLALVAIIGISIVLFAVPLSDWVDRAPSIWRKFQSELANFKQPLQSVAAFQEQLRVAVGGEEAVEVTVQEGNPLLGAAMVAPAIGAQIIIFLASLYFFLATREHMRISILSLCITRRLRWRAAHIFRDVEQKISSFLVSVTLINLGVGIATGLSMWAIGVPSPILWGALAGVLNYVPYLGLFLMSVILLAVGMATQTGLGPILLPVGAYLVINFIEGQIVTPHFLGRTMTVNPFLIFLSITFWLWAWGPAGAFIAVPSLIIMQSVLGHILPSRPVAPRRPVPLRPGMSKKEIVLANAAAAVREQKEAEEDNGAEAERASVEGRPSRRTVPPPGTAPDGVQVR